MYVTSEEKKEAQRRQLTALHTQYYTTSYNNSITGLFLVSATQVNHLSQPPSQRAKYMVYIGRWSEIMMRVPIEGQSP